MFTDPQTLTVNGSAKTLVKINQDQYSGEYLLRTSIDEIRLRIRNTNYVNKTKMPTDRHNVEVTWTVFATGTAPSYVRKFYVVMENQLGDTLTDPVNLAVALCNWLTASTAANAAKLLNNES